VATGYESIKKWIADLPRPVGILAGCDGWGNILSTCARSLGLRVPEDVAIVGVDDEWTTCEITDPPLSSVAIPWELIGRTAAQLAGDAVAGRTTAHRPTMVQPLGVTARRSSDVLAVADPDVAAALATILAHAGRPLTVSQILRAIPTTQRHLEQQFKKVVGRKMIDEIRRVHVEHAKRLLSGTDLPMPMVARKSGFSSSSKLGIAFRRETETTPTEFRRRYRLSP
jgi:LacI family transcriptional regulator